MMLTQAVKRFLLVFIAFIYLFVVVLGIESTALGVLGNCRTVELHPSTSFLFFKYLLHMRDYKT